MTHIYNFCLIVLLVFNQTTINGQSNISGEKLDLSQEIILEQIDETKMWIIENELGSTERAQPYANLMKLSEKVKSKSEYILSPPKSFQRMNDSLVQKYVVNYHFDVNTKILRLVEYSWNSTLNDPDPLTTSSYLESYQSKFELIAEFVSSSLGEPNTYDPKSKRIKEKGLRKWTKRRAEWLSATCNIELMELNGDVEDMYSDNIKRPSYNIVMKVYWN